MRVILTGITGNLGHEVALDLHKRGFTIIPIVRSVKNKSYKINNITFGKVISNDLMADEELEFSGSADCIVHCAGNIHFFNSIDSNEKMIVKLIRLAKNLQIPLYFVSTAYIYRPPNVNQNFNNAYELDKFRAEQILNSSGIKYGIFRPSVLVGNSKSGTIQNYSGYYSIVKAFYAALNTSKKKGKKLRFPNLSGKSNLVPVDQAAFHIGNEVQNLTLRSLYVTNPDPPAASWVLKNTLDFFNLNENIDLVGLSFMGYGNLELTSEEQSLYKLIKYYYPYWSITYDFPPSICKENLINHEYLFRTLSFLKSSNFLKYG